MDELSFRVSDFQLEAAPQMPEIAELPTAPMPALATSVALRAGATGEFAASRMIKETLCS